MEAICLDRITCLVGMGTSALLAVLACGNNGKLMYPDVTTHLAPGFQDIQTLAECFFFKGL